MSIDPRDYRNVVGTFATGVTVITMPIEGGSSAWGMTANSVTSLSLDPTLVLVCVDKNTRTHQYMLESPVWAVNILAADQETVSRTFALKDFNEQERMMAGTPHHRGVTGAPIIDDCLSYLDCRTYTTYEGGDHTIFLGEVIEAVVVRPDAGPLLFFKGRYRDLAEPAQ